MPLNRSHEFREFREMAERDCPTSDSILSSTRSAARLPGRHQGVPQAVRDIQEGPEDQLPPGEPSQADHSAHGAEGGALQQDHRARGGERRGQRGHPRGPLRRGQVWFAGILPPCVAYSFLFSHTFSCFSTLLSTWDSGSWEPSTITHCTCWEMSRTWSRLFLAHAYYAFPIPHCGFLGHHQHQQDRMKLPPTSMCEIK